MLYPSLSESTAPTVRATAMRFQNEMGGLAGVFKEYVDRWPRSQNISENPESFVEQTLAVVQALRERIAREENDLYPLLAEHVRATP